jgi:hypothetical protein
MSIEADFRATLAAHAPLTALVGTRIALNSVPENSVFPLVVYAVSHDRTLGLNNSLLADQAAIDVQCWADTAAAADAVAEAALSALVNAPSASGAVALTRSTTFDPELGIDGVILSVEWWG